MLTLRDLSVNAVINPVCVPTDDLRFGWKLESDRQDVRQTAYRIVLAENGETLWDSGTVLSAQSIQIPCAVSLPSRSDVTMTVTVTDNQGEIASASQGI